MAKFEIQKFDPIIYPRKIWVAKGGTKDDIFERFLDDEGDGYCLSDETVRTSYAVTDSVIEKETYDYGVVIWLHKMKGITDGTVAHEADHATNIIFKAIGAKVDVENDETHAYLVGFITDCISKVRKGKWL